MSIRAFAAGETTLLQRVRETIRAVEPGARIILYGSHARGDPGPDSDWDFLVLLDGSVDRARMAHIRDALFELELALDDCPVLSSVVRGKDEWDSPLLRATPFHQGVEREGIEL